MSDNHKDKASKKSTSTQHAPPTAVTAALTSQTFTTVAEAPPTTPTLKAVRRNIIGLWNLASQNTPTGRKTATKIAQERLDRYYIAFHRLVTEGEEFLFFIAGVHNGGWYSPQLDFVNEPMFQNCQRDTDQVYAGTQPHPIQTEWPDPQRNSSTVQVVSSNVFKPVPSPNVLAGMSDEQLNNLPNQHISHQFCWHAKGPFFIWHRPYMLLFEQVLQYYDPATPEEKAKEPLGCHYFGWETTDGTSPHPAFFSPQYYLRTDKYAGYPKGSTIPNPLYRWYAPRSFPDQYRGRVASPDGRVASLDDTNCTTREPAFLNNLLTFAMPWRVNNESDNDIDGDRDPNAPPIVYEPRPSIEHLIENAMNEPAWHLAGSIEWSPSHSMEEPHNRFHNRFGGVIYPPSSQDPMAGTLTSNQSPFDPLFWPHHSNVERQLLSWQRRHVPNLGSMGTSVSDLQPKEASLNLYPWASPDLILNTPYGLAPAGVIRRAIAYTPLTENNGFEESHAVSTMEDWYYTDNLPYTYDFWETPCPSPTKEESATPDYRLLTLKVPIANEDRKKIFAGVDNYTLTLNFNLNGVRTTSDRTTSFISAASTSTCAACNAKEAVSISFDVSNIQPLQDIRAQFDQEDICNFSFTPKDKDNFTFQLTNSHGVEFKIDLKDLQLFYARSAVQRLAVAVQRSSFGPPNFTPDDTFFDKFTKKHFEDAASSNSLKIRDNFANEFSKMNFRMIAEQDRVPFSGTDTPAIPGSIVESFKNIVPTHESAREKDYYGFTDDQKDIIQPHIDDLLKEKLIASRIAVVNTPVDTTTDATWVTDYLPPHGKKTATMKRLAIKYPELKKTLAKAKAEEDGLLFVFVDAPRVSK